MKAFPKLPLLCGLLLAGSLTPVLQATPAEFFPLEETRLLPGPFLHAQQLDEHYLLALEPDRLLAGFRSEAGLQPKAPKYPNWESSGLDGHTLGHYLAALAQMAAVTDNPEFGRRLDYCLSELSACQKANGNGYVGAVPHSRDLWAGIAAGRFDAQGFSLGDAWVPWYNVHKTFAGLRDAWLVAHRPLARDLLIGFADWCAATVSGLSDEKMQVMLRAEHGGMDEVLADVYSITGDHKYLALAQRFAHRAALDPLLRHEDRLTGLHANTQIPKVIGFARIAELGGDPAWRDAADFFWHSVTTRRSVAFGGNSVREHFNPAEDFSGLLESREGPESCNTYNMLRLTEQLFRAEVRPDYAAFYERALFNHILSTQHPVHGGFVYFTPIRPEHYRVYSQPSECFWCCVGTGLENHGKYGRFIYAHEADGSLLVNLFIASRLDWREKGLQLTQDTAFPDQPRSAFLLKLNAPARFALRLRHPTWIQEGTPSLTLNGKPLTPDAESDGYWVINREWHDGDRLTLEFAMKPSLEFLPDGSPYAALLYGPIVLAARTDTEGLDGLVAGSARMGHIAPGAYRPLDEAPMLVGSPEQILAGLTPVRGESLLLSDASALQPAKAKSLQLEPFFRVHDARYMLYWRVTSLEQYPKVVAELDAREKARLNLERLTVDQVAPGEQQPEVDHGFHHEGSYSGSEFGRQWRETKGWFSYQVKVPASGQVLVRITTFGRERDSGFDLLIDGKVIATQQAAKDQGEKFVETDYNIPAELLKSAKDGHVELRLRAKPGSRSGRIFGLHLLRVE